jgi:hypothetical protein
MPLIVEDGTGLSNADAYISLADARIYAAAYGYTLPDDDTLAEIAIRQGTQYIDMQESCFGGTRLVQAQSLSWPRLGAVNAYGFEIASDSIPLQLGYATVAAADEFGAGTDVRATDDGKSIASEEVTGAVAVSYFNNGKTGGTVTITKALDALKSLLVTCANNGFEFRVGRG